jgi:hypothetical protein
LQTIDTTSASASAAETSARLPRHWQAASLTEQIRISIQRTVLQPHAELVREVLLTLCIVRCVEKLSSSTISISSARIPAQWILLLIIFNCMRDQMRIGLFIISASWKLDPLVTGSQSEI